MPCELRRPAGIAAVQQDRMHPCLQVPELLDIIFHWLGDGPSPSAGSLASLACTCRSFLEPALDVLWSNLANIGPLIKLLPEDVWSCEDQGTVSIVRICQRPLEPHEWTVFLRYAARIRVWGSHENRALSPAILADVSAYTFLNDSGQVGHLLFPNLRRIEWIFEFGDPVGSLSQLSLMLGPRVVGVTIRYLQLAEEWSSAFLLDKLKGFIFTHTTLEHLKLYCPHITEITFLIPSIIARNQGLRTLEVLQYNAQPLPREAWLSLSRLPKLEKTVISADEFLGSDQEQKQLLDSSDPIFESMRHVTIYAHEVAGASRCLDLIRSKSLASVSIIVDIAPTNQDVKALFTVLIKHRSCLSLRSLIFNTAFPSPGNSDSYVINTDTLRVLLSLQNIVTCRIGVRCPMRLDNAFLADVAASWALTLNDLDFGSSWRRRPTERPAVTLKGLLPLVGQCKHLKHLGLVFNPSVEEFKETYNAGQRPCKEAGENEVASFATGASLLEGRDEPNIIMLAGILSDLFPSLQSLKSLWDEDARIVDARADEDPDDEVEIEGWKQVAILYKEMSIVRRQERAWMKEG
ncbi:hypothetical protein DAEQUDRAFT_808067 [Daedalea quercina L-15889]|uniref:F-box domain-containing protein n=1 Tax=Daedalea quercina L-15889 TaxID=1314783 RepID=A0A165TSX7_9APHY|nr:hypothetical protein DAEQUDRAFT_808067 [Daedalea quercina L-15889]